MKLLSKVKAIFNKFKKWRREYLSEKKNSSVSKTYHSRPSKPACSKPKAIVFVDYEHWFYSYRKLYHMTPDIFNWQKKLEETYFLNDIMVFANFSGREIREELTKLRTITNSIIETQQITNFAKEMTDFIMLDYIYQYVIEHPEVDTFILFTGERLIFPPFTITLFAIHAFKYFSNYSSTFTKALFGTPHNGQTQSSGKSTNLVASTASS